MSPEEIKCMVTEAVKQAIKEEREDFYIDNETHFKHHDFLEGFMAMLKDTKGVARRAFVKIVVWGFVLVVLFGVVVWLKLSISDLPHGLSNIPKIGGK